MRQPSRAAVSAVAAALVLLLASDAGAARLEDVGGHIAVGYGKLFTTDSPGGSLSIAGGLDYPLPSRLRAGVDIGYHLLGSRTVVRGSLAAGVDYSVLEADAFLHWRPTGLGPLRRLSAGPALMSARAVLSPTAGGAGFSDLAVETVTGGAALEATLMGHEGPPIRLGLELGARIAFLAHENWTIATARLAVHY